MFFLNAIFLLSLHSEFCSVKCLGKPMSPDFFCRVKSSIPTMFHLELTLNKISSTKTILTTVQLAPKPHIWGSPGSTKKYVAPAPYQGVRLRLHNKKCGTGSITKSAAPAPYQELRHRLHSKKCGSGFKTKSAAPASYHGVRLRLHNKKCGTGSIAKVRLRLHKKSAAPAP